jgi:hypothetical protein
MKAPRWAGTTWLLVVWSAFTVALIITVATLADVNTSLASRDRTDQYQSCTSGNKTRLVTRGIMYEIVGQLPAATTPLQKAHRSRLKHDVTTNYSKQNNCGNP